jgi:hypothetical protein
VPVSDAVIAPHRLEMGLLGLRDGEPWIEIDSDLASDLQEKRRLLRERRAQVFAELDTSRDLQREALARVSDSLLRDFPSCYRREGSQLHVLASGDRIDLGSPERPPLETAALCVQEDLCVMQELGGSWCLVAGAVCFPTRWDLPSQLGRPMTAIHERVPGYRGELDRSANRFFDGMKAGRVFRRGNWSLMDDPALFQPTGKHRTEPDASIDADSAGERVWLRIEHQTLQRLPTPGAILFGIRIHRARLDELSADTARTLVAALHSMSPAMQLYKSLAVVKQAVLAHLERRLASA